MPFLDHLILDVLLRWVLKDIGQVLLEDFASSKIFLLFIIYKNILVK